MQSLVSWEVHSVGGFALDPRVVPSGASYSVADETFVVLDVFGALGGGEVDSVYIHCHRVFSGLFRSCVGGGIPLPTS